MKNSELFSIIILLFISQWVPAQVKNDSTGISITEQPLSEKIKNHQPMSRKGKLYFYWGYNRSAYSKSDIHFWGEGYDFTITDIKATDEPTTTLITYIKPNSFSVPEYNYRLGFFLTDKTFISLGEDHMKYTIEKQATRLSGSITAGQNAGKYDNTEVLVGENKEEHSEENETNDPLFDSLPGGFVPGFEHCDGLNDVSLEMGRVEQLWMAKNEKNNISVSGTLGAGMVIPDTDADVLGQRPIHGLEKKTYHLAGYSFSGSLGAQFEFCKYFFLQSKIKAGYINLPDIKTTIWGGRASQHFYFIEPMIVFGYARMIGKK